MVTKRKRKVASVVTYFSRQETIVATMVCVGTAVGPLGSPPVRHSGDCAHNRVPVVFIKPSGLRRLIQAG